VDEGGGKEEKPEERGGAVVGARVDC